MRHTPDTGGRRSNVAIIPARRDVMSPRSDIQRPNQAATFDTPRSILTPLLAMLQLFPPNNPASTSELTSKRIARFVGSIR